MIIFANELAKTLLRRNLTHRLGHNLDTDMIWQYVIMMVKDHKPALSRTRRRVIVNLPIEEVPLGYSCRRHLLQGCYKIQEVTTDYHEALE